METAGRHRRVSGRGRGVGSVWGVSETRSVSAGAAPPSPVPACTPGFASLGTPLLLEGPPGPCLAWPPPPPLPVSFRPLRTSTGQGRGLEGGPRGLEGKLPAGPRPRHPLPSLSGPTEQPGCWAPALSCPDSCANPRFPYLPLPSPAPDGRELPGAGWRGPTGGTAAWRGHRPQGLFHHCPGPPETPAEGPGARDSQVPTLGQEAGFRDAPGQLGLMWPHGLPADLPSLG